VTVLSAPYDTIRLTSDDPDWLAIDMVQFTYIPATIPARKSSMNEVKEGIMVRTRPDKIPAGIVCCEAQIVGEDIV